MKHPIDLFSTDPEPSAPLHRAVSVASPWPLILRLVLAVWFTLGKLTADEAGQETNRWPDLVGTWRWDFKMPDGSVVRPRLRLTVDEDHLTGYTSFRSDNAAPVTNLVVDGKRLRFQVVRAREGTEVTTTYSGTVGTETIRGTIEANWAGKTETFPWEARRIRGGVDGVWRWSSVFPKTNAVPATPPAGPKPLDVRVDIEERGNKLVGRVRGRAGLGASFKHGALDKETVSFDIERSGPGGKTSTHYQGKLDADRIRGTMTRTVDGRELKADWVAFRAE